MGNHGSTLTPEAQFNKQIEDAEPGLRDLEDQRRSKAPIQVKDDSWCFRRAYYNNSKQY
jgi:hypothetical protein